MNKTDLINKVIETTGLTKKDAIVAVESTLDAITDGLKAQGKVSIVGFGNFEVRDRAARQGINPKLFKDLKEQGVDAASAKAQATISIPASKAPAFKAGKKLKESVN